MWSCEMENEWDQQGAVSSGGEQRERFWVLSSFMISIVAGRGEFICCGRTVEGLEGSELGGYPGARTVSAARP